MLASPVANVGLDRRILHLWDLTRLLDLHYSSTSGIELSLLLLFHLLLLLFLLIIWTSLYIPVILQI